MRALDKVFSECVKYWGATSQILMAVEELSELSVELCHALRANKPFDIERITEEMADAKLMLEQLQFMLKISDKELAEAMEKKIRRLQDLLKFEKEMRL